MYFQAASVERGLEHRCSSRGAGRGAGYRPADGARASLPRAFWSGGAKQSRAQEIENLILAHPSVFNTAVVAMPHAVLGERSCAHLIVNRPS
jgi:hypothetical protein